MQTRALPNVFTWLFFLWASACLVTLAVVYRTILWWEASQETEQAQTWGLFLRNLLEREIDSQESMTDLRRSEVLAFLARDYQLDLAIFSPLGQQRLSSITDSAVTIPPEAHTVIERGETFASWIREQPTGRTRLVVAWPKTTETESYLICALIDFPMSMKHGRFHQLVSWGVMTLALGVPIVWGLTWLSKRRLEVTRRSILEGVPLLKQWDLREWRNLAQDVGAHFAQQRRQIEVLEKIAFEHQAVLEHLPDGLLFVTLEGRVIKHNPAAARLLRLPTGSVEGFSVQECLRRPEFLTWMDALLSFGQPPMLTIHSDDPEQHLEIRGAALKGYDDRAQGFLLIIRDMTRTWAADRVRRDFVANVSHELRTPLTSIKGFLETLLDGALDDPPQANRFVRIIHEQTERLERIVNDLLTLARLESEQEQPITREPVRVAELLTGALDACRFQAEQRSMRIHCVAPDDLVIRVNGRLLQQALVNLLDNAMKYSDPNKEISVTVQHREKEVVFEIQDQGWGIEARHLPRVFERFYRVDPSRSRQLGGTGLGLAIVKHVAQLHGGYVTVDSRVGVGTVFRIHLPGEVIAGGLTPDEASRKKETPNLDTN